MDICRELEASKLALRPTVVVKARFPRSSIATTSLAGMSMRNPNISRIRTT
jgi:hypothetical protein